MVSQSRVMTYKVVKAVRALTEKTLIAKITPEVTDIRSIARAAEEAGAEAVSLVNTFYGLRINIETRRPYLGNVYGGYSGRAIKPLSLYRLWRVYKAVSIPVIAGGGVENASDAIEFILAGASAVSLGTVNLVYPRAGRDILNGIKDYMRKNKVGDIRELVGALYG